MQHHMSTSDAPKTSTAKWFGICLLAVIGAIVAIKVFSVPVNTIVYLGILLACPLMHFWMMRGGGHKH